MLERAVRPELPPLLGDKKRNETSRQVILLRHAPEIPMHGAAGTAEECNVLQPENYDASGNSMRQ
jgi:hypothetical protein